MCNQELKDIQKNISSNFENIFLVESGANFSEINFWEIRQIFAARKRHL